MPTTKIKISFDAVSVKDSADIWGDGEWVFDATIDGKAVGDPKVEFVAVDKGTITLPAAWSAEVDVSKKTSLTDSVKVTFSGKDIDVFSDDDLGAVSYEFKYPFAKDKTITLESPVQKGWAFFPDHQYYTLTVTMTVVIAEVAGEMDWNLLVNASRQTDGSSTFTTASGYQLLPRVEVCPVVPSPITPSAMPERPDFAIALGLHPGRDTPENAPITMWPQPDLNATYNPSLIPIISETDPDFAKKVAKLAVTFFEPADLDPTKFTWKVKSGPSKIVGDKTGAVIQLVGTGAGASDELTEVEVRWDGEDGNLLSTFRAWVGKIKQAKYRINLINGTNAAASVAYPPQDYANQLLMTRTLYWQAGIELIPDDVTTCWDGATTTDPASGAALPPGVFIVPVTDDTLTVNVNNFAATPASRLNFRPGILHAVYVCSTPANRAAATDIQGVDGSTVSVGGTPSSSWVIPSGVPPDGAAGTLTMKTFPPSNRTSNKAAGDDDYVTARCAADASFSAGDMARLYAAVFPSSWSTVAGTGTDPNAGINAAHELGHCLGLMHRGHTNQGSGAGDPQGSDDGIDCLGTDGVSRGHPWHENIMTYGYAGNTANIPRGQDIDLLQTSKIRKHPALT